jgi:hypothetical protein
MVLLTPTQVLSVVMHSRQCNMTASAALSRSRLAFLLNAIFHLSLVVTSRYELNESNFKN